MPTRRWGAEKLVNTITAGHQSDSAVTALADGGFVIAWADDNPTDSLIRYQRYDVAGLKLGNELTTELSSDGAGDQTAPALAQLSDGNLWIVQQDFDSATDHDALGGIFGLTGALFRYQSGSLTLSDEIAPVVASLGANGAVAVWQDLSSNNGDIYMRVVDAVGVETINPHRINYTQSFPSLQSQPDVAANKAGTHFTVVWYDDGVNAGDIRVNCFRKNGDSPSGEFSIKAEPNTNQQAPKVAWLDNSRFVVTWTTLPSTHEQDSAVNYAIFGTDGISQIEGLANTTVASFQGQADITALPDGGFVIAWEDYSNSIGDTSLGAIRLQAFDSVGDKRGGEILVNTTTSADQIEVSLAALADGRVVVTWTDFSSGTADIRMQIVDPRDGIVTGTGGADTLYGHHSVGDEIGGYAGDDSLHGLNGDDVLFGGEGNDFGDGGADDDVFLGGTGNDIAKGRTGDDELNGEEGNDILAGNWGADTLDGGAGTDIADYRAEAAVIVNLTTFAVGGAAAGEVLMSIESVYGSDAAADTITGNSAANGLSGYGGNDTLNGAAGADILRGGLGNDTMTGGTGADAFVFGSTLNATSNLDKFRDFSVIDDTIRLDNGYFIGLFGGALPATAFRIAAAASDADVRIVYNSANGALLFDADGTGAIAAVRFATLAAGLALTNSDFAVI